MSEYTEPHSVSRLVGAPPGYVGHDEGGQLTEAVRRKPYTVVLFDEVEKAHPRVLTLLLQVLDEGRLTDSKGRTVDFTNAVIILTSNLGAQSLLRLSKNSPEEEKNSSHNEVMAAVRGHFSPEFLNRLSAIVMFNSLGVEQLEKICHKAMRGVKRRLASQLVRVVLEKSGVQHILDCSYDPHYGARPVERYLEQTVVTQLSKLLISGEIASGCVVRIIAEPIEEDDFVEINPVNKRPKTRLSYKIESGFNFTEDELKHEID
jgi:ATP-dependent Clp protease ATP-binding subunit ClpB